MAKNLHGMRDAVGTTLRERLQHAMQSASPPVSRSRLARACGASTAAVAKWFRSNATAAHPTAANLLVMAPLLNVRPEWLSSGELPMRPASHEYPPFATERPLAVADMSRGAEEARAELPELLDAAERGLSTLITRRGRPVAELVPVGMSRRAELSLLTLSGTGRGLWDENSADDLRKQRDEWQR